MITEEEKKTYVLGGYSSCLCWNYDDLVKGFPWCFIYGLPKLFFDVALLWRRMWRNSDREIARTELRSTGLPSWSWAGLHKGWLGLDLETWSCGYNYLRGSKKPVDRTKAWWAPLHTIPNFQWYTETREGKRKIPRDIFNFASAVKTRQFHCSRAGLKMRTRSSTNAILLLHLSILYQL
jgi:hypothetical protein